MEPAPTQPLERATYINSQVRRGAEPHWWCVNPPRLHDESDVTVVVTYLHFMPPDETEWSLQKRLTRLWLQDESVVLDGERLFLAAWEVMTDFRINDSLRHWNLPSIDFVFLDRAGRMVVVELKRKIITPRESWSVICQVTHRAHELAAGYCHARLEGAYNDCHSGADGRMPGPVASMDALEAHARTFDQPALCELPGHPVRRLIMAKEFGSSFARVLADANSKTREQIITALERYKPRGEIQRYLNLQSDPSFIAPEPIRAVTVDRRLCRSGELT